MAAALPTPEFVEACGPWDTCVGCSTLGHYCAKRGETISCADLVSRMGFDATDRPSPGTSCAACELAGHMCPAKGMAGDYALCLACGRGEICDQAKSVERLRTGAEEFEIEDGYTVPECRTIAIADADRVVTEAAPAESAWAIKGSLDMANLRKTPRPKPVKAARVVKERKPKPVREPKLKAVKQENPKETVMEKMELEAAKAKALEMAAVSLKINPIAKATGWDWANVRKWLVEAGLLTAKTKRSSGQAKKKPSVIAVKRGSKLAAAGVVEVAAPTVTIVVTERSLDALWSKCSLNDKARTFAALLEAL